MNMTYKIETPEHQRTAIPSLGGVAPYIHFIRSTYELDRVLTVNKNQR